MLKSHLDQSDSSRHRIIYLELRQVAKPNPLAIRVRVVLTKWKVLIREFHIIWWSRHVTTISCDRSITPNNSSKPSRRRLQCTRGIKTIMECPEGITRRTFIYLISRLWPTLQIRASCISNMVATRVHSSRRWPLVAILKVAVAFRMVLVRLPLAYIKVAWTWTSR